jgi:hypothetical protein
MIKIEKTDIYGWEAAIKGYYDYEIAKEIGCSRGLVSRKIRQWGIRNDKD